MTGRDARVFLVGPLVYFLARDVKGHGIPELCTRWRGEGGRIRPRVVLVKALALALSTGSGGFYRAGGGTCTGIS
ncbi:MAG: chloride channel protein [Bacillota bacterium]|nr:chloride channel protein [Bacillota bacterium]